jgi:hypothetical protein
VGACEPEAPALGEATVKYHPDGAYALTTNVGPRLVGSLTGAVAS